MTKSHEAGVLANVMYSVDYSNYTYFYSYKLLCKLHLIAS